MSDDQPRDSEWMTFMAKLQAAEQEFVQGQPAAFKQLWSRANDVTLCGGFGGIASGWQNVAARLDWASSKYSNGSRTSEEIRSVVGNDFAYVVQNEVISFRMPGRLEESRQELRATMVFRHEVAGWRILHRHADSQTGIQPPS